MPVDRKRKFQLPTKTSKDQDTALAKPLEGRYLIKGGPGTGKSVVALLRARQLSQESKAYHFLVYNKTLLEANKHLFGNNLQASTWESWFRQLYRIIFSDDIPSISQENGYRAIDWEKVSTNIQELNNDFKLDDYPYLVIDEGQDMPPVFYKALINLGFENIYVVADQNQQLEPNRNSTIEEIQTELNISDEETQVLTTNYRNTYPIALLALAFYTGDPANRPLEMPKNTESAHMPELLKYQDIIRLAENLLRRADTHPRKLFGVITPNNAVRETLLNALNLSNPKLDNDKAPVRTYSNQQYTDLDFGMGGIMVINTQSCKGLEFDTAILADIDLNTPRNNTDQLMKRFYVMVARARDRVYLLRNGQAAAHVEIILPPEDILARRAIP